MQVVSDEGSSKLQGLMVTPVVQSDEIPVTGIGASAGGLVALQDFFTHVPSDAGMAYVVVVHLSPDRESQIAPLLQKRTAMPVVQVERATTLEPDHVYVIPPDSNLSSVDGRVELLPRPPSGQNRSPIDLFFRSLAETHGAQAAAIVLSGTGSDGAEGLRRVKEVGGITLVQEPGEAEHPGMPVAAIRTGMVDRVLGTAALGPELARLRSEEAGHSTPGADDLEIGERVLRSILGEVKRQSGHDFTGYRLGTVNRRMRRRMQLVRAPDAAESSGPILRRWRLSTTICSSPSPASSGTRRPSRRSSGPSSPDCSRGRTDRGRPSACGWQGVPRERKPTRWRSC